MSLQSLHYSLGSFWTEGRHLSQLILHSSLHSYHPGMPPTYRLTQATVLPLTAPSWPPSQISLHSQLSVWVQFTTRERPGNHWIRGWVDPRAHQDDIEKWKFLTLLRLKLWALVIQPKASCYTDYATMALYLLSFSFKNIQIIEPVLYPD
jgi:hypothetical protein